VRRMLARRARPSISQPSAERADAAPVPEAPRRRRTPSVFANRLPYAAG
jgi:hypothetical protein